MNNTFQLEDLESFNHHLEEIIQDFNRALGLSVLIAVTSSLYTTMYYLYRLSTASDFSLTSNKRERLHYIIGLIGRSGKLLGYMLMGNQMLKNSQQPLEAIRKSRILNLPMVTQQQIQTLMLQWLDNKSYMSAGGIVNVGPWLLAPIVGNVITYLLVALQFNEVKHHH
ncbi:hypothetical protein WA026_016384 [Henosepilachna vigintioctopunctata]|uniref:Uncharacterized protein n=1 Tax=Henosepilachna vigintioctopunctata TaxID=420089 RepID=A0AAW1UCV6_9CUCU